MRTLLLLLMLGACAVKGYDLGWRKDGTLAQLLGSPLDRLSDCVLAPGAGEPAADCRAFVRLIDLELSRLAPVVNAPESLGARCEQDRCTYANVYERRDVGAAFILPVYKRIVLREARIGMVLAEGRWRVDYISIRDNAPPGYGPVTVGGAPVKE